MGPDFAGLGRGAADGVSFAGRPGLPRRLVPNAVVRRRVGGAGVLLTFDDGPHAVHTPAVLDRLRGYGQRAVFFAVGSRVARAPGVLRRVAADGHRVGNHTFTHRRLPLLGVRAAWRDVGECQRVVTDAAGVRPRLFRPPLGRLTPGLVGAAWGHGLGVLNWSLDSGDWRCRSAADAARCAAEVLDLVRPGDVLLFHDDHGHIARILDAVLPGLAEMGLLRAAGSSPAGSAA